MKYSFLFLFFAFNCAIAQTDVKSIDSYFQVTSKLVPNDTIAKVYSIDLNTLDAILDSKNKTVVVYSFSVLCKISRQRFPIINEILLNKKNTELIIVSTNTFQEINLLKKYFKEYNYYSPIFILDTTIYGNKKDPSKRNDLMVKYLCKDCDPNNMGFSDFFIKDSNKKIVYKSAYETTIDEMKEILLKYE